MTAKVHVNIAFPSDITNGYPTCRQYVEHRVHQQGRPQSRVAADMDYSPSILSRKLAQNSGDTSRFTLDDLELFIQSTGDIKPVYYLVAKYLYGGESEKEALLRRLAEIEAGEAKA